MGRGPIPMRRPKLPFRLAITARSTFGISPSFLGLSQSSGQVTHVLLTRSRLCPRASPGSSLHLHVLSTPPAFVLSQDQTLREELHMCTSTKSVAMPTAGCPRTRRGFPGIGRGLILAPPLSHPRWRGGRRLSKPGRTRQPDHSGLSVHMLLSFQRPPCLPEGTPPPDTRELFRSRCGRESIALARRRGKLGFLLPRTALSQGALAVRGRLRRRIAARSAACGAGRAGARQGRRRAGQDSRCTTTSRLRGRSSKSISTICCQVPSTSAPSTTGTLSDGPISAARRWACAFVSALRRLCS